MPPNTPPLDTLGRRLRYARAQAGYRTQAEFAHKLGIVPQQLGLYETRSGRPGRRTLARITELTGVSEVWLLYGLGTPPGSPWLALVDEYLRLDGSDDPRVAERLRALDPSTVCLTNPHIRDVRRLADLIALHLRDGPPSRHGSGK